MIGGPKNSNRAQHTQSNGPFRQVSPNLQGGGSPDLGRNPVVLRSTWTAGVVRQGGAPGQYGVIPVVNGDHRPWGVFVVNSNNFAVDAWIQIGGFTFCSNRDFAVGGNVGATATNIVAMFNAIPGWFAAVDGAEVTVRYPHPGKVRFEVRPESGAVVNFNGLDPADGFLNDPQTTGASAPVLT